MIDRYSLLRPWLFSIDPEKAHNLTLSNRDRAQFNLIGSFTSASVDTTQQQYQPACYHYRTSLDQSCSCRVPGKTWAETLADAERILSANGSTDAQISELKAQELSRPRDLKAAPKTKPKKGDPVPTPVPQQDLASLQYPIPAGTDIVPLGAGDIREIVNPDGTKRKIRILRAPGAAAITE